MIKLIALAMTAGGILLIVLGVNATNSFTSEVSTFFTGSPTDKSMWMLIGGGVALALGLIMMVRRWK